MELTLKSRPFMPESMPESMLQTALSTNTKYLQILEILKSRMVLFIFVSTAPRTEPDKELASTIIRNT